MKVNKIIASIPASSSSSYPILIGTGLLNNLSKWMPKQFHTIVIITDHLIKRIYGKKLLSLLSNQGYSALLLSFPAGEKSKNILTKCKLEDQMFKHECGRDTLILALGGGVVGDMAGFIAATYMRGISYIQIPTSLLAMIDSSIGGKTAINTAHGKNLIGAYWQPSAVIADTSTLNTLPKKHLINGLIEAIKIFITSDAHSFKYLQNNFDAILNNEKEIIANIVNRAVKIKSHIVQQDVKENNLRKVLNFGHTIGHAIEKTSHYEILHGYAVGYGILIEAKISQIMGFLAENDYFIIKTLLNRLGINTKKLHTLDKSTLIKNTKLDKKIKKGQVHYVLLSKIGQKVKCLMSGVCLNFITPDIQR